MKYIKLILLDDDNNVFVFSERNRLVLPYAPIPARKKQDIVAEEHARELGFDNISLQPAGQGEHKNEYFTARVDRLDRPDYKWIDPNKISHEVDRIAINITRGKIIK